MEIKLKEWLEKIKSIDKAAVVDFLKGVDRKTWVQIGIETVAVFLFIVFAFYPGWVKRPALKKQTAEVETQMIRLRALIPKKPEFEKQKQEIQTLIADFQKKLFTEKEMAFLLGKVSKIAFESRVELIASRPLDNAEEFPAPYSQKYKKYIYQITVEGSYHQVADLVSRLESSDQYFHIQSLNMNPQPGTAGKLIADINLMAISHTMGATDASK